VLVVVQRQHRQFDESEGSFMVTLATQLAGILSQSQLNAIFDLYSHLLNDARLKRELFAQIDADSAAEWAVKQVVEKFAVQFTSLQDTYVRERARDLRALQFWCAQWVFRP
jgi:signal transduction protein with GAF and PtsI domain